MDKAQSKFIPVQTLWQGKALKEVSDHILAYRNNPSDEYFEQHLYAPFSCLINYFMVKYANKYPEYHEDWTNYCFIKVMEVIPKWDGVYNVYSYMGTCIKHEIFRHSNKFSTMSRDIRKEIHLDGLEDEHKESIINSLTSSMEPVNESKYFDIERISEYYGSTHGGKNISRYYNFVMDIVAGKIHIPEHISKSDKCQWMSKTAGFADKERFKVTQTQFKAGLKKFIKKKYGKNKNQIHVVG